MLGSGPELSSPPFREVQMLCYVKAHAINQGKHLVLGRMINCEMIKRSDPELDILEYEPSTVWNGVPRFQD